jgi:hypothetical protein
VLLPKTEYVNGVLENYRAGRCRGAPLQDRSENEAPAVKQNRSVRSNTNGPKSRATPSRFLGTINPFVVPLSIPLSKPNLATPLFSRIRMISLNCQYGLSRFDLLFQSGSNL